MTSNVLQANQAPPPRIREDETEKGVAGWIGVRPPAQLAALLNIPFALTETVNSPAPGGDRLEPPPPGRRAPLQAEEGRGAVHAGLTPRSGR